MSSLTPEQIAAKLAAIAAENSSAENEIKAYLGPERWSALITLAMQRKLTPENIAALCGNLRRSRKEWDIVKGNDRAALILAANHFILEIGGRFDKADEAALKAALNPAPEPSPAPAPAEPPAEHSAS